MALPKDLKFEFSDEWPTRVGNGRMPDPMYDRIREVCGNLKVGGQVVHISGFPDRKMASNAGGVAINWGNAYGKKRGWAIRTATEPADDGSWKLLLRKVLL